jgi:hypothetical protein
MVRRTLHFAAVVVLAAGCGAPGGGARFRPLRPAGQLDGRVRAQVRVVNEAREVVRTGRLVLELKLVNVSGELGVVYNELGDGRLVVIEILGEDGGYVRSPAPLSAQDRAGKHHYAALPPRGFVGRQYVIRPSHPAWNLAPGRYRVRVVYRNRFPFCVASPCFDDRMVEEMGKDALVPLLTGLLVSNVETFRVTE